MITNTGKNILAKYLIGQAPAYASYIAIGCGSKPMVTGATLSTGQINAFKNKKSLDFEMFRVPIVSRGYVNENGVSKIVLTAELPTEERYEISEVGIFSAGSNNAAGAYDSKTIYSFSKSENWEQHNSSGSKSIPSIYTPLDKNSSVDNADNNIIGSYDDPNTSIVEPVSMPVFQTNADNKTFSDQDRVARYEGNRFLNNMIMISGDYSNIGTEIIDGQNRLKINSGSNHIHLTGTSLDFNKNAPTDEIKLAFSLINKNKTPTQKPERVRIMVEFSSSDTHGDGQWARFETDIADISEGGQYDFETNRYFVITKQLQELYKSSGFTWNSVDVVKIYCSIIDNGVASSNFYIALDALRLENVSSENPLYGLTGYTIIKNTGAKTILKAANSTSYIEFRFAMDIQ